jgi:hypothetical protein
MQRSEKASGLPADSSHEFGHNNRIPQVRDRFLPMDHLGCNQQIHCSLHDPGHPADPFKDGRARYD